MFEATLKNISKPDLDAVIIEFPIPEERYEETLRALERIEIGAALDADCCVVDLCSTDCPALRRMIDLMVNMDELDWLGKQLESFDRYELLQFNAAAECFDLSTAGEMIDLSLRSREVTVISDFNDLELAGRRHYLTKIRLYFLLSQLFDCNCDASNCLETLLISLKADRMAIRSAAKTPLVME